MPSLRRHRPIVTLPGCLHSFAVAALLNMAAATVASGQMFEATGTAPEAAAPATDASSPSPQQLEFFEKQVRPLLAEHCYSCHSSDAEKLQAGLLLDSRERMLTGGDSGPAVVPGSAADSLLMQAVRYELYEMPPSGKLAAADIDVLARWIEMGAPWPAEPEPGATAATPPAFNLQERRQAHWAWQKVADPPLPAVKAAEWPQSPLDRFVLATLEAEELQPAAPVDRRALLRRLYFDLIGLPPTHEQIAAYLSDESPGATEKVVDALLASPHFGERWGRHWLDLVRYAESRGHEYDHDSTNAYQYRDYVIRALNADVPYDQLLAEHIAGDLLATPRLHPTEGFNESILGTGYWFLGEWVHSPVDTRKDEAERFDNMIDVMSKTFLGLTVSCARCHDHKFDAISTRDYYGLVGFLQSSDYRQVRFESSQHSAAVARSLASLAAEAQPKLRELLAAALLPGAPQASEYLLAAGEFLKQQPQAAGAPLKTDGVAELARQRTLDAARLTAWCQQLHAARSDKHSLLAAWFTLEERASQTGSTTSSPGAAVQLASTMSSQSGPGSRVIIDYAACPSEHYLQNGYAFGAGPVLPGEILIEGTTKTPELSIAQHAAALYDKLYNRLEILASPGVNVRDEVSTLPAAGRTLYSPTFELASGTVSYLVRGSGHAFACVDSHRMVARPLHTETVLEIEPDPGSAQRPRWVSHDLKRHRGHRLHVEFTPHKGGALDVLMVVDGEPPAGIDIDPLGTLAASLAADSASTQQLAERYAATMNDALGSLLSAAVSPQQASVLDWMVRHRELFVSSEEAVTALDAAALKYAQQRDRLAASLKEASHTAMAMIDLTGEDEHVFIRGNSSTLGEIAARRFLEALAGPEPLAVPRGSGRLQLATAMNDAANPLVPRVVVNRLWHHLLGRGIVPTVDDFGVLGQRPTHPELLDHLATWFIEHDRSLKQTIKYIVLSSTYQMSSTLDAAAMERDPANRLWHHVPPRRLQGEVIRDALLALAGRLDPTMYGPSVPIHLTAFMDGRGRPRDSGPLDGDGRRSIYIAVRRNFLSPMMLAYDTPVPFSTMGRRNVSNVPAQALILMNDPLVVEQTSLWARRALEHVPHGDDQAATISNRIGWLVESAYARPPREAELALLTRFVEQQAAERGETTDDPAIWAELAHVLVTAKEFIFIP